MGWTNPLIRSPLIRSLPVRHIQAGFFSATSISLLRNGAWGRKDFFFPTFSWWLRFVEQVRNSCNFYQTSMMKKETTTGVFSDLFRFFFNGVMIATSRIIYLFDVPPSPGPTGKWRFRLGSPNLKMFDVILVVTLRGRGHHTQYCEGLLPKHCNSGF